jgi:hypothetical protein
MFIAETFLFNLGSDEDSIRRIFKEYDAKQFIHFKYTIDDVRFVGLTWEYEYQENTMWLFCLNENRLFRMRLVHQVRLNNMVGDIRVWEERSWTLVGLFVSTTPTYELSSCHRTIKSEICELGWKITQKSDSTLEKSLDEKLSNIVVVPHEPATEEDKSVELLKKALTDASLQEYLGIFLEHGITVDQLILLGRPEITELFPRISDRVRFLTYQSTLSLPKMITKKPLDPNDSE